MSDEGGFRRPRDVGEPPAEQGHRRPSQFRQQPLFDGGESYHHRDNPRHWERFTATNDDSENPGPHHNFSTHQAADRGPYYEYYGSSSQPRAASAQLQPHRHKPQEAAMAARQAPRQSHQLLSHGGPPPERTTLGLFVSLHTDCIPTVCGLHMSCV